MGALGAIADPAPNGVVAETLLSLLERVPGSSELWREHITTAFRDQCLRLVESLLLTDEVILRVARQPYTYLGREREVISGRVAELFGVQAPVALTEFVFSCLSSSTVRTGAKARLSSATFQSVIRASIERHPRRELRCAICGYHFRSVDFGQDRRSVVTDLNAVLAVDLHPGRIADVDKPQAQNGKSWTECTIDHILPEAGFGWTSDDNLQVACHFCNAGRLIFRRPLEPFSTMVAMATTAYPESRPRTFGKSVVMVSAIGLARHCSRCGRSTQDVELTVDLRDPADTRRWWYVVWNLDVLCYQCSSKGRLD
jgi:hypothetical protein